MKSNATYIFELNSDTGETDGLSAAGAVSLGNGSSLSMRDLGSTLLPPGLEIVLVNNGSTAATTGEFANFPSQVPIQVGVNWYEVDYAAAAGADGIANDVVAKVSAVPEPTTALFSLVGLSIMASGRSRRAGRRS